MTQANSFSRLAIALRARRGVIADRELYDRDPAGHLTALKSASENIDIAAKNLPQPVDSQLKHFIQRQSYDKALAWLESHTS